MKITNDGNLPEPLHNAIVRSMRQGADASDIAPPADDMPTLRVSDLLRPPRQYHLMKEADATGELTVSSDESIYALIGSIVHSIVGEYRDNELAHLIEKRLGMIIPGRTGLHHEFRLIGKPDSFNLVSGLLTDWKIASVWEWKLEDGGVRAEKVAQNNLYALLLRANGHNVTGLQNAMLFRDWSKSQASRTNAADYPRTQVALIENPVWDNEAVFEYVHHRAAQLLPVEPKPLPLCTEEDRWARGGNWAIEREDRKSALALADTEEEAWNKANARHSEKVMKGAYAVRRPLTYTRCDLYCYARAFCTQAQEDADNE